jgi:hypothetical protein
MGRGYGKPPQEVKIEDDAPPKPTHEQLVARLLELLPRVISQLPIERRQVAEMFAKRARVAPLSDRGQRIGSPLFHQEDVACQTLRRRFVAGFAVPQLALVTSST